MRRAGARSSASASAATSPTWPQASSTSQPPPCSTAGGSPPAIFTLSQPEPTIALTLGIAKHGGRLLFLVGDQDQLIGAEQRRELKDALTTAQVRHELIVYPDTPHAFFWEGTDTFRPTSRDNAWRRMQDLLAAELAPH